MTKYPEHEKIAALNGENEVVGDFIEWLRSQGYSVCKFVDGRRIPNIVNKSTEEWIAEYFELDREKFSEEKEAMFKEMRAKK